MECSPLIADIEKITPLFFEGDSGGLLLAALCFGAGLSVEDFDSV